MLQIAKYWGQPLSEIMSLTIAEFNRVNRITSAEIKKQAAEQRRVTAKARGGRR